jgi:glycosyltransferase involved in cell wall biosynthesis
MSKINSLKVSIITVCFNSEHTIEDTIRSVSNQSYNNIEYIIIDGGSVDGTQKLLNKFKDNIDVLVCEPDDGIYDAMNKGVALASGDIVGILNSDDYYLNDEVIASVVNKFTSNPLCDVVLGHVDFVTSDNLVKPVRRYFSKFFSSWQLFFGLMPPHPGSFIRKSVYEKEGLYKINYRIAADFEYFVRVFLKKKYNYVKIDKCLVRMRMGGISTAGLTSNLLASNEMVRALNENNVYSNKFLVSFRLPVKLAQLFLFKLGIK